MLAGGLCLLPAAALPVRGDNIVQQRDGWEQVNGKYYYYRSGKKVKGLFRQNGKVYYLNPYTGARMTGIRKIRGRYYYFDPKTGVRKRGLIHFSGKTYYFPAKWYAVKGFHRVNGKLLYCDEKGLVCSPSGIVSYGGHRYYYDPKTGKRKFGWIDVGQYTYYFSWSKKYALTGWQTILGKEYYFNARGVLLTNRWIGSSYYVDDDGRKVKGWLKLGDETYYLDQDTGKMAKGFVQVKDETYYLDENGLLVQSAWVDDRYLNEDGVMAKNTWVGAYYVGADGRRTGEKRIPGFFTDGENTYYLNGSYQPMTGWIYVGADAYYLDEVSGVLQKNLWVGDYYVGADGKRVTAKLFSVNGNTYYFDEDGLPATGLLFLGEDGYFFDQSGVMKTGFVQTSGVKYYFDTVTGKMAVNVELSIQGVRYLFNEEGRVIKETKIPAGAEKGQAIADYALLFEGNPYKSGGVSLTSGADSSGFTQSVLAHFGIAVPRLSANQATGESSYGGTYKKPKKIQISELLPGDLIFYGNPINHVAIYVGNRKVIHAFNTDQGIIQTRYDYKAITGCVRYW